MNFNEYDNNKEELKQKLDLIKTFTMTKKESNFVVLFFIFIIISVYIVFSFLILFYQNIREYLQIGKGDIIYFLIPVIMIIIPLFLVFVLSHYFPVTYYVNNIDNNKYMLRYRKHSKNLTFISNKKTYQYSFASFIEIKSYLEVKDMDHFYEFLNYDLIKVQKGDLSIYKQPRKKIKFFSLILFIFKLILGFTVILLVYFIVVTVIAIFSRGQNKGELDFFPAKFCGINRHPKYKFYFVNEDLNKVVFSNPNIRRHLNSSTYIISNINKEADISIPNKLLTIIENNKEE